MFSRFIAKPSSSAKPNQAGGNLISPLKRRNILYTSLLSCGLLLSGTGYNVIKDLIDSHETIEKRTENMDVNKDELRNISVVTYINFDTREEFQEHSDRPLKIETPHLEKHQLKNKGEKGEIRGVITDEKGCPINAADVLLYRNDTLTATTYTIGNGGFSFPETAAHAYTLKVLREGYRELDYPEFKMASNATTFLDICLENIKDSSDPEKIKSVLSKVRNKDKNPGNAGNFAVTVMIENPYGTGKK